MSERQRLIEVLRTVLTRSERLIFAPTCGGCGWPGTWWCRKCWASLPWLWEVSPRCRRCSLPLHPGIACPDCPSWPAELSGVRALFRYEGPIRSALHRVKYRGERRRGEELGSLLARYAECLFDSQPGAFTAVVPVPLHESRLHTRGFNQSALLAKAVADRYGWLFAPALVRQRATASQVGLERERRWSNVAGAFAWLGRPLSGTVLLVDDVVTTGATIAAATAALVACGAERVTVLSLARSTVD